MLEDSDGELAASIRGSCSLFGTVTQVRVYPRPSDPTVRPFALISMVTREEAEMLAAACGGRTLGRAVMLVLQKSAAAAPERGAVTGQT